MASLIYWTTSAPNRLTDELILAGYRIWEALAYSEVEALIQEHNPDLIVIDPDVPLRKERAGAFGRVCILIEPGTTPQQVLWEVEQLIPSKPTRRIQ